MVQKCITVLQMCISYGVNAHKCEVLLRLVYDKIPYVVQYTVIYLYDNPYNVSLTRYRSYNEMVTAFRKPHVLSIDREPWTRISVWIKCSIEQLIHCDVNRSLFYSQLFVLWLSLDIRRAVYSDICAITYFKGFGPAVNWHQHFTPAAAIKWDWRENKLDVTYISVSVNRTQKTLHYIANSVNK